MTWQTTVERTVSGLGYELVACERLPQGLLRVTLDRVPGATYATGPGEVITVDDCERVTRQLQFALQAESLDWRRLEVSSPGLDRPLVKPADYQRFAGAAIDLTLRQPFEGRKHWRGTLVSAADAGVEGDWALVLRDGRADKVLAFRLDEVREARLVPVVDFKGRGRGASQPAAAEDKAIGEQAT